MGDCKGEKTGAVTAFAIEPGGKLRLINQLSSHGADPCHVSLTRAGKHGAGGQLQRRQVASYLVGAGGELAEGSFLLDAGAHGPHANQDAAHAHFIVEGPTAGLVYVADLGLDKVLLYDLDARGQLKPHAGAAVRDGHPAGQRASSPGHAPQQASYTPTTSWAAPPACSPAIRAPAR